MTKPASDTIEREQRKLYLTDAELIRRLGVPEDVGKEALRTLDENPLSGFPKKQKLWGDRRWWRAVEAYLDRRGGLTIETSANNRGPHERKAQA